MDEVTEGTLSEDQPGDVTDAPPEGTSADSGTEVESFTDVDPNEKPEGDYTPEWLQERYKQMQGDYTRKRQADAEAAKERQEELDFLEALRSDKETQQAVFEQLQELLNESEESGDEETPAEGSELERTVRELQQAEEERQAQTLAKAIVTHIEQLAKDAQVELDEDDLSDIFNGAISGEQANADTTSAAFKKWTERRTALHTKWQKAYLASKEAPTQLPSGQSATDKPDLSDRDTRIQRFAAILEGGQA